MIRPATGEAGAAYVGKTDMVAALIRELIITGELTTGEQLLESEGLVSSATTTAGSW